MWNKSLSHLIKIDKMILCNEESDWNSTAVFCAQQWMPRFPQCAQCLLINMAPVLTGLLCMPRCVNIWRKNKVTRGLTSVSKTFVKSALVRAEKRLKSFFLFCSILMLFVGIMRYCSCHRMIIC